jgi:hypothetical protein
MSIERSGSQIPANADSNIPQFDLGLARDVIGGAQSLDDLIAGLDQIGGLKGESGYYSSEDLKNIIQKVRANPAEINSVTRTAGLRWKVDKLLDAEKSANPSEAF